MTALEILSVLFGTAALFGLISKHWLKLPATIGTMLLTALATAALTLGADVAPGIHHWAAVLVREIDFGALILHGMLPFLLFAGAFLLDLDLLAREKAIVAFFSVVGTALSFFLVALLMELFSGGHLPWIECLIFGALIAPTDPIAVLEMLRRAGVPGKIQAQLAGESLFNDGLAAVIFIAMLDVARGTATTPWHIGALLLVEAGGAVLIGVVGAWCASRLMRICDAFQVDILFAVALAVGGYALAEHLKLSAPLEAVVAGIALRYFNRGVPEDRIAHELLDRFWEVIDEVQNSVLFVLLGLEAMAITANMQVLRTGVAAIFSVNFVRFAVIALLLAIVYLVRRRHRSSVLVLTWGGLRGGLSIALALSVPEAFGRSWMLGATYMVVFFSIVIQGGSMDLMLRKHRNKVLANVDA